MSYCTKIQLENGERLDLFTPTTFRFRKPQFETQEIPDIYDIPFAVGKTDDWDEVEYEFTEEKGYFQIKTSQLYIYIKKRSHGYLNKVKVKDLEGNSLYPNIESVYGMFSNKCIVFDSASFFFEPTTCDRESKWFYNRETGLYDIFLEQGIYDLYFIYGKTYKEGYKKFNTLVGAEPMLTKKGYGYYQTQFLGERGSQETVMRTVEEFRKRDIPLDTFILDLDWGDGVVDGKGARWGDGIDWDINFKSPLTVPQMLEKLKEQNVEVMLIHHSIPNYENRCNEGWVQKEYDADLWWQKMKEHADMGVVGTWQDTRSTEVTDSRIYKGLQDIMGNKRCTFLGNYELFLNCSWTKDSNVSPCLQRLGGRRTPFKWTGDSETNTWEEFKFQVKAITNVHGALKGVSYITNDATVRERTDIAVRSIQFLCFTSIVRCHDPKPWHTTRTKKDILAQMMAIDEDNHTVLEETEVEQLLQLVEDQDLVKQEGIRNILKLRYRLLPYVYTLAHETYETGLPFTRPLMIEFEEDELCNQNQFPLEYMFGESILVAPVCDGNATKRVYLPEGQDWYDWFTGEKHSGGQVITVETTDLSKMPLFVKQGAIIPLQDECNFVEHGKKLESVEFLVYPGNGAYTLYEDDGVTLDYKKGVFATTEICAGEDENGLFVDIKKPQGKLEVLPEKRFVTVRFIGKGECDYKASCDCATVSKEGKDLLVKFEMNTNEEISLKLTK